MIALKIAALRWLHACPRFRGRDRLIGAITKSISEKPVVLSDDIKMLLDPAEWIQQEILIRGATEPATLALLQKLSLPGATIVDVGAHVGHHAIKAAMAVGGLGRVLAFDPQPYNADRIARHAALNDLPQLLTCCAAIGSYDGYVKLPLQSDRDRARLSLHSAGPSDETSLFEVPLRRLDTVLSEYGAVSVQVLKIDVEGYELEVLKSLGQYLGECRNIILEMLDSSDAQRNQDIISLLADSGFELRDVAGNGWKPGTPLVEHNLWAARV